MDITVNLIQMWFRYKIEIWHGYCSAFWRGCYLLNMGRMKQSLSLIWNKPDVIQPIWRFPLTKHYFFYSIAFLRSTKKMNCGTLNQQAVHHSKRLLQMLETMKRLIRFTTLTLDNTLDHLIAHIKENSHIL